MAPDEVDGKPIVKTAMGIKRKAESPEAFEGGKKVARRLF